MKIHRTTLCFFIALIGTISCLPSSMIYPTVTPVPPITHTVSNLIGVKPIWTLDDIYVIWNENDITLDAFRGKTCFLGDMGKRAFYKTFVCLESQSGQPIWTKENGIHDTIAMTPEGIFVAYSRPAALQKFDLETGDLVRRRKLSGTGSMHLTYLNNQIQVATSSSSLWILDTDAKLIERVKKGQYTTFLSTPDETFVNLKGLQVLKTGTNEVLWEHVDMQRLRQIPIFTEDKLFLRNFTGTAYALERTSGEQLWEIPNIVGNLVYSPDKHRLYALQENANLLTIDENTGKETIIATFAPSPFLFFNDFGACAYQLAYDPEERILVVYLGDSSQLFAFQEE